jgi:hypothetical protein
MKISTTGAQKLGLPNTITEDENPNGVPQNENWKKIKNILLRHTTPKDIPYSVRQTLYIDGKSTPCKIKVLQIWNNIPNEAPVLASVYGHIDVLQQN